MRVAKGCTFTLTRHSQQSSIHGRGINLSKTFVLWCFSIDKQKKNDFCRLEKCEVRAQTRANLPLSGFLPLSYLDFTSLYATFSRVWYDLRFFALIIRLLTTLEFLSINRSANYNRDEVPVADSCSVMSHFKLVIEFMLSIHIVNIHIVNYTHCKSHAVINTFGYSTDSLVPTL